MEKWHKLGKELRRYLNTGTFPLAIRLLSHKYDEFYITGRRFSNTAGTMDNHADLCPAVQLFDSTGAAGTYEEIILGRYSPTATDDFEYTELIYMTLIEPTGTGFDGTQVDFELIVPQDGHNGGAGGTSDYYFYVELEAS